MDREETTPSPGGKAPAQKLTNQFNFCERASQTYNNPYRVSIVAASYYLFHF